MADRNSIKGVIALGQAFAKALRSVEDSNAGKKLQCNQFAAQVESCGDSWQNLALQLQSPYLKHGRAFEDRLERIIDDNVAIINRLREDLCTLTTVQRQAHGKLRNISRFAHPSDHPLVKFIGNPLTLLRQRQIKYTTVALKLILAVALHASSQSYRHSSQSEQREVEEEQHAAITAHYAECLNPVDEQVPDNKVYSHQWLRKYDFNSIDDGLPLETVATLWFRPEWTTNHDLRGGRHAHIQPQDDDIARVDDMRRQHDIQEMEYRHQTTIQELYSRMEEQDNSHTQQRQADRKNHDQQRRDDMRNYDQQWRAFQASIDQLNTTVRNLGSQVISKDEAIDKLKKQNTNIIKQNNNILSELRAQKERAQKLENQLREHKVTIDKLQKQNGKYRLTIENLNKDNEKYQQLARKHGQLLKKADEWQDLAESRKFEDDERTRLGEKVAKLEQQSALMQNQLATKVEEHKREIRALRKAHEKEIGTQSKAYKEEISALKTERDTIQAEKQQSERTAQAYIKSLREKHTKESVGPTSYSKHHRKRRQSPVRSERKVQPESIQEQNVPPSKPQSYESDSGYSTETFIEASTPNRDLDKASTRSNKPRNSSISVSSRVPSVMSSPRAMSSAFEDDDDSEMEDYRGRTNNLSYRSRTASTRSRSNSNNSGGNPQIRGFFRRMF